MNENGKPKWGESEAIRRGREAHHLAEEHTAALSPRLPEGTVDELGEDLGQLTGFGPDRRATRTAQKGQTGEERALAREGKDWVMSARESAKRSRGVGSGALKALGVGEPLSANSTTAVLAALTACLNAFAENSELAGAIGLIEADLDEARTIKAELAAADAAQAGVMEKAKDKTFDRNAVQMRIEAAVDMISARGRMAFRRVPDIRGRFEALTSTSGPGAKAETPVEAQPTP
jgi:hypothetical protein